MTDYLSSVILNEVMDNNTLTPPNQAPRPHNNLVPFLLGSFVTIGILLLGFLVWMNVGKTQQLPSVAPVTPTTATNNPSLPPANNGHSLLYVKDKNVYSLSIPENKETQITQDGAQLISYRLPKWIDNTHISYVRCVYTGENTSGPYICSLMEHNLSDGATEQLLALSSKLNSNNVHTGANITFYAWNHARTQAGYFLDDLEANSDKTVLSANLIDRKSKQVITLDTFTREGGRGGMLDDTLSFDFSPDDTMLLLNYTGFFPNMPGTQDRGTIFIYNTGSKKLIYSKPGTLSAFGQFRSNTDFLVKQISGESGNSASLVSVELPGNNETVIGPVGKHYDLILYDTTKLAYLEINNVLQQGIRLGSYDMSTKQATELKKNLLKKAVLPDGLIIVETMKPCTDGEAGPSEDMCGIDAFNGYITDALATFDPKTGTVTPLQYIKPQQDLYDIDAR